MGVMWRVLTLSLLCWDLCSSEDKITCRDKNGVRVDWYVLYKVPQLNNYGFTGLEYVYIAPGMSEWHTSIKDTKGVLAHTLEPLLKSPTPDCGFISYNDQPPGSNALQSFGHSKGVVMMDKTTGVWLLHSTPDFPYDRKQKVLWPDSGAVNGQTFICVTLPYKTFNEIGKHLLQISAFPFDYNIPDDFHTSLQDVVKRKFAEPKDPFLVQDLTSRGGHKFKSFAKYSSGIEDAKDLYFRIAKILDSDLSVQSWRGSKMDVSDPDSDSDSDCSMEGKVINTVENIVMTVPKGSKRITASWTDCNDHSKWCVTEDERKPLWTCISDLNRVLSQDERPGGALCIEGSEVRKEFKAFIDYKENCPVRKT
ncbi:deoxyribonuclease-2-alpha-like [Conger conger]|uniref:deoxyribonuclease-2-alpha-like n=1 Tax=Conger conger TaxID=82655 RepID=UPI002A59B6BA|nr:deoxyribonuclease-2-alpha-like [Conger conger]